MAASTGAEATLASEAMTTPPRDRVGGGGQPDPESQLGRSEEPDRTAGAEQADVEQAAVKQAGVEQIGPQPLTVFRGVTILDRRPVDVGSSELPVSDSSSGETDRDIAAPGEPVPALDPATASASPVVVPEGSATASDRPNAETSGRPSGSSLVGRRILGAATSARRLSAYVGADGPREALRKANTRRRGVGQHGRQELVRFVATEVVTPDGGVASGPWRGSAIGQVLEDDEATELITWHYGVTPPLGAGTAGLVGGVEEPGTANERSGRRSTATISEANEADEASVPSGRHVALVGAGAYMHNIVVPALVGAGVSRFTVTDASLVRARRLAATIGSGVRSRAEVEVVASPLDILEAGASFDGLVIACAHSHHGRYAARALANGARVLVEKPAATTGDQLDALVRALGAAPTGATLRVGHNRRFARDRTALATSLTPRQFVADVEGFPLDRFHWYRAPGEGGRTLGNLTHWLDLSLMVFDDELPLRLRAEPLTGQGIEVALDFGARGRADIRLVDVGPRVMGGRERLSLRTDHDTVTVDDWSEVGVMSQGRHRQRRRRRDRGHHALYSDWVASLPEPGRSATATGANQPSETAVLAQSAALGELVRSHQLAFLARAALSDQPGVWVEVNPAVLAHTR